MVNLKCAGCSSEFEVATVPKKKFLCPTCHAVNTVQMENAGTGAEACNCILPTGFEWQIPAGRFETPFGVKYSTADDGTQMTRAEWIESFGCDPEGLWEFKQKMGKEGKPGYINLSGLGKKKVK